MVDLYNFGTLLMNMSTIRNNQAARGGGIFQQLIAQQDLPVSSIVPSVVTWLRPKVEAASNHYGTVSLNNSTVSNNSAPFYGGIGNEGSGVLTLMNVTVASNYIYQFQRG